ncbi:hypothetical protein FSP39_018487 [Pinctada imbricata]|uniref:Uncharacterized protein n=1 Tax=Pinctada imbricata TaxID=66713 RepID=A0AA88YWC8_PINIB|nr:hypothetical protein FSP39_018487 [Pinctada imbricata]
MPPTILKRKHSLKGKNLFPLVKKVRDFDSEWRGTFAKLTSLQKTEELSKEDCFRAFQEITGEDTKEFISITGKEYNEKNCRVLILHCTIVHANFCGQPGQTPSAPAAVVSTKFFSKYMRYFFKCANYYRV